MTNASKLLKGISLVLALALVLMAIPFTAIASEPTAAQTPSETEQEVAPDSEESTEVSPISDKEPTTPGASTEEATEAVPDVEETTPPQHDSPAEKQEALATVLLAAGITPFAVLPASGPINTIFPDPVLAQAVASQLGKAPTASVTQNELNTITSINIGGQPLHNLEGVQYLNGLKELRISNCQLTNRFPTAFLTDIYPKLNIYEANNQRYTFSRTTITSNTLSDVYAKIPPLFFQMAANTTKASGNWVIKDKNNNIMATIPAVNGTELQSYVLDGSFSPGDYSIELTLGYPAWMGLQNSIYTFPITYSPSTTGKITGTVTDQSGNPLAGVTITLAQKNGPIVGSTTTNAKGFYSFSSLSPANYTVTAELAGYDSQTKEGHVSAGKTTVIDFTLLGYPGSVFGTVTSGLDGLPLSGASVTLYDSTGKAVAGPVQTDAKGTYFFDGVPSGNYSVSVSNPGYSNGSGGPKPVGNNQVTLIDVVLDPLPVTLSGTIYENNTTNPISGATVVLAPGGQTVTTEANGTYSFSVVPKTYTVTASASGYSTEQTKVTLSLGTNTTGVDLYLVPNPVTVTVTVVDSDTNAPLSGATVTGWPASDTSNIYTATTDNNGQIIRNAAPGEYFIEASFPGYASGSTTITFGSTTQSVTIPLQKSPNPPILNGTVLDAATRQPVSGASITTSNGPSYTASTNGSGFYQQSGPTAGVYENAVTAPGYYPATHTDIELINGQTTVDNFFLMPIMGSLTGTVTYTDGTPAANIPIEVNGETIITDENGQYFFFLNTGSYDVEEQADGQIKAVTIVENETAVADFVLPVDPGKLTGTVTNERGEPLVGANISAYDNKNIAATQYSATTDAQGHYTINNVYPSTYSITASHKSYGAEAKEGVVLPGKTTVVDFVLPDNPGNLEGTVTSKTTGEPLPNTTITVLPDGIKLNTDEAGYYSIMLVEGDYTVEAHHPDYTIETKPAAISANQTTVVDFRLGQISPTPNPTPSGGSPQTGDYAPLALIGGIAVLSGVLAGAVMFWRRRLG